MTIVAAPTSSSPSPTPVNTRNAISSSSESATVYDTTLTAAMSASCDDEDPPSAAIADPSGDRLADEEHRADRRDRERDAEAPDSELVVRIDRNHREQHPDRQAQRELGDDGEDEGLRQDAIRLHRPIQAERPCPDGLLEAARARQRARGTLRGASRGRLGRRHRGGAPWRCSPWSAGGKGGSSSGFPGGPGSCSRYLASSSVSTSGSARRGSASSGTRMAALVLLAVLVLGNLVGVVVLVGALVTTKTDDLDGVQLLVTTGTIWARERDRVRPLLLGRRRRRAVRARAPRAKDARLPIPAGRDTRGCAARLAPARVGLHLPRADECDRLQPDRHDAADAQGEAARRRRGDRLCSSSIVLVTARAVNVLGS